jgi:small subunit ribosomal protein S5
MVKATMQALKNIQSPRSIASKRGKKVSDIFGHKNKKDQT